ncbi:MAG: 50S ribosomal protein L35 [Candidatus Aureabacteria bacterium]|nr:50S ribosomal protein L35 [Candidatus Auribacterota bacterium]
MPKIKTKKAAVKRFKKSKGGKILHSKANAGHLMGKKTGKRKRKLRKCAEVSLSQKSRITRMLP